jgi:hypothetical protein
MKHQLRDLTPVLQRSIESATQSGQFLEHQTQNVNLSLSIQPFVSRKSMPLSDIALFASIVSSAAVAASLVYLALQVHQNTRHTRAHIQQARVTRLVDQMVGFSDADKCAAYIRGNGGDPTPDAISDRQFYMQCISQVATMSDNFYQHKDGLLNDEQFSGFSDTYRAWLLEPGFRQHWLQWKSLSSGHTPQFMAFVDSLLLPAND